MNKLHAQRLLKSSAEIGHAITHAALMVEAALTNGRGLKGRYATTILFGAPALLDWRIERDIARFALIKARHYLVRGRLPG